MSRVVGILLLFICTPASRAGEQVHTDNLASWPAVAEVEVTRVLNAPQPVERIVQVRVRKQVGVVKLPQRLHFIQSVRDWSRGKAPPPWYADVRPGQVCVLAVKRGRGGAWRATRVTKTPGWKWLEDAYRIRRRIEALPPDKRTRRLAALLGSDNHLERYAAVASLPLDHREPTPEVVELVAPLRPEKLWSGWTNRHSGRLYEALVRAWQRKPTREAVALSRVQGPDGLSRFYWARVLAEEVLVRKAVAGDDEAVTFWVQRLKAARSAREIPYQTQEALGAASNRKDVRQALIAAFELCDPKDNSTPGVLACIASKGAEGFGYVADCLAGKGPAAARGFAAQGLRYFFFYLGRHLACPEATPRALRMLDSADAKQRAFGAHALGLCRHAPAAAKLTALFDNDKEDQHVRLVAARALLGMEDGVALEFCRRVLARKEPVTLPRCQVYRNDGLSDQHITFNALGRLGDIRRPPAVALLEAAAKSPHEVVRFWAGAALGRQRGPEDTSSLWQRFRRAAGKDPATAREVVHRLARRNEPGVWRELRRLAAERGPRLWLLEAVASDPRRAALLLDDYQQRVGDRSPGQTTLIAGLVEQLDDDRFTRREQAGQRLAGLGMAAFPELMTAAGGDRPEQSRRARELLARLRMPAEERLLAAALLLVRERRFARLHLALLASEDPVVRVWAGEGLESARGEPLPFDPLAERRERHKALARFRTQIP